MISSFVPDFSSFFQLRVHRGSPVFPNKLDYEPEEVVNNQELFAVSMKKTFQVHISLTWQREMDFN